MKLLSGHTHTHTHTHTVQIIRLSLASSNMQRDQPLLHVALLMLWTVVTAYSGFGNSYFVLHQEAVLFLEVKNELLLGKGSKWFINSNVAILMTLCSRHNGWFCQPTTTMISSYGK